MKCYHMVSNHRLKKQLGFFVTKIASIRPIQHPLFDNDKLTKVACYSAERNNVTQEDVVAPEKGADAIKVVTVSSFKGRKANYYFCLN